MITKLKTKITAFALCLLGFCVFLSGTGFQFAAQASSIYDEFDQIFISTINEIFDYEETAATIVAAEKTQIYDIALQPLGIQYSFDYADTSGFAIIILDNVPVVTEIATDGQAPFANTEFYNVYVSHEIYWKFDGTVYFDCATDLPIYSDSVEQLEDKAFRGSGTLYYDSEQITFLYRSETKYNILSSIPIYNYGGDNACAAVAGSNIIAYYDKTYTNLISNYEPGTTFLGIYKFKVANVITNAVADTLYNDMGINSVKPGATISQFRTGLTSYINRQGYSVGYSSLVSWGNLNFENAKTAVQSGKAIALFMSGFRNVTFTLESGYDVLKYEYSDTNHVSVGFGCLEVNYTLTNNSTRTDKYIHSSIGVGLYRNGYINIATTQIDDALVINIS